MTYDPHLGRWLEEDPIGFDAGDMNLYRMEGNDPINRTDPSGLEPPDPGYMQACSWFFGRLDYEGLDGFPMPGNKFYDNYIKLKYGNCWNNYRLGCLGLAKSRLGIPEYSLHPRTHVDTFYNLFTPDVIEKWNVKCFKDYRSAADYYNSIKGEKKEILAAQFDEFRDVKPNPKLGKNEIDPNTVPTIGSGNYATLQYGPGIKDWYWEWMGTGESGNDFNVKHILFQPDKQQKGLPSENKHTVYCVYTIPAK